MYHGWEGKCSEILATPSYSKNPRVNKDIRYDTIRKGLSFCNILLNDSLNDMTGEKVFT